MKRKTNGTAALVVAVLAAITAAPTAFAANAQVLEAARWCPEGLPCDRANDRPRLGPTQVRPKLVPVLTRNAFGRQAWRSGGWMME
jgi:hypothetical protein